MAHDALRCICTQANVTPPKSQAMLHTLRRITQVSQTFVTLQGMMMAPQEEDARALFLRHGDVKDDKDVRYPLDFKALCFADVLGSCEIGAFPKRSCCC